MKNTIITILAAVMSFVPLFAQTDNSIDTVNVTVTATGETEEIALYNALDMAVIKATGVSIESRTDVINFFGGNEVGFAPISRSSFYAAGEITRQTVERSFKGYVKTFEVLSTEQRAGSESVSPYFEVEVSVDVYKYTHPVPDSTDKRARIVVSDFKQTAGNLPLSDRLSAAMTDRLMSTGKFSVLDREYLNDFIRERNIISSSDAALPEKARLAMVCGGDLMVSGTVRRFTLESALRQQQESNRKIGLYQAKVEVEYRLIIPSTLQTRLSDTITLTMSPQQVNALWEKNTPADLELDRAAVERAIADIVAEKIVNEITDRVYPITVAYMEDGIVYLNEGGKRVSQGDIFDIYNKDTDILDPQTGLLLGTTEEKVAAVKVDMSAERMSFAKIVSGNANDIKIGALSRKREIVSDYDFTSSASTPTLKGDFASSVEKYVDKQFTPAKIAVLPFRTAGVSCKYFGEVVSSRDIAEKLDQYLTTSLSKTGKFELLDRDYQAEYDREIQLILDNSPIEDILPTLEKVAGAQYLLVGRLAQFDVSRDTKFSQASSFTSQRYSAQIRAEYRIIELATRKIAHSDTMDIVLDDGQLKSLLPQLATTEDRGLGETQIKYSILSMAATNIAGGLVDELFPILVVAVEGDTIAISSGGEVLSEGQQIVIFKRGEKIRDPYTGAELGSFESIVATAVIKRVLPSISYATITYGEAKEGYVCRAVRDIEQAPKNMKKSDIEKTSTGGVVLPMDR